MSANLWLEREIRIGRNGTYVGNRLSMFLLHGNCSNNPIAELVVASVLNIRVVMKLLNNYYLLFFSPLPIQEQKRP